jgi:hypothetical protein
VVSAGFTGSDGRQQQRTNSYSPAFPTLFQLLWYQIPAVSTKAHCGVVVDASCLSRPVEGVQGKLQGWSTRQNGIIHGDYMCSQLCTSTPSVIITLSRIYPHTTRLLANPHNKACLLGLQSPIKEVHFERRSNVDSRSVAVTDGDLSPLSAWCISVRFRWRTPWQALLDSPPKPVYGVHEHFMSTCLHIRKSTNLVTPMGGRKGEKQNGWLFGSPLRVGENGIGWSVSCII